MSISISSIKVRLSSYTYSRYVVWNSDLSWLVQGSYQFVYGESICYQFVYGEIFKALNLKKKRWTLVEHIHGLIILQGLKFSKARQATYLDKVHKVS